MRYNPGPHGVGLIVALRYLGYPALLIEFQKIVRHRAGTAIGGTMFADGVWPIVVYINVIRDERRL